MNDIVFWLWGPALLMATAIFGLVLMRWDTRRRGGGGHHPAE